MLAAMASTRLWKGGEASVEREVKDAEVSRNVSKFQIIKVAVSGGKNEN